MRTGHHRLPRGGANYRCRAVPVATPTNRPAVTAGNVATNITASGRAANSSSIPKVGGDTSDGPSSAVVRTSSVEGRASAGRYEPRHRIRVSERTSPNESDRVEAVGDELRQIARRTAGTTTRASRARNPQSPTRCRSSDWVPWPGRSTLMRSSGATSSSPRPLVGYPIVKGG